MENVQTQIDYSKGITFEQVWASLDRLTKRQEEIAKAQEETDRLLKENAKETDRLLKKNAKETDRLLKENAKDTDRQMKEMIKENDKRFGNIDNRFGELVECIISPNLLDKFSDLGIDFQTASSNFKVRDHKNKIYFEIDVFLQNGDTAMLVEIKTNLTIHYINEHIERLGKMRLFSDLHNDSEPKVRRTFLGAVAGVVVPKNVKEYALSNGFYLVEPSGEDLFITIQHNKPKEW